MDLGEVLQTYLSNDQQGQLVIKFVGEDHLCKISVENGQAIYLSLGSLGPQQALDAIVGRVAEWSNFIKGMPPRKRLDEPINQRLLDIAGVAPLADDEVPLAVATGTQGNPATAIVVDEELIAADRIGAAISRFVDLVGPFASILTEQICSNLAYTEGAQMNAATYTRFIAALAAEIPEDDRQGFIDAAAQ